MLSKFKKMPVETPRFHTEILWSRVGNETRPVGFGVRDTQTGDISHVHPIDTPIMRGMLPEAVFFRARNDQEKLTSVSACNEFGKKTDSIGGESLTRQLMETRHAYPSFDSFKNNPYLELVPLSYNEHVKQRKRIDQGYALIDGQSGKILRHVPQNDMNHIFKQMGCTKIRVGKYGTVTSVDLADGNRISAKELIDGLVQVKRAEPPRKTINKVTMAATGMAAALAVTGVATMAMPNSTLSQEFNQAAAPKYETRVIKRTAGTDAMASVRQIENRQLRVMMRKWFIDGTYQQLASRLGQIGLQRMETDDEVKLAQLDKDAAKIERAMVWPVEAARAVDTMWKNDRASMKALGFRSPAHMLDQVLATIDCESYSGIQMTMPLNPSVEGYYHFNRETFLQTKRHYEHQYGKLQGLPRDREGVLELRNDAYVSTLMFLQYTKEMNLGRHYPSTDQLYRRHVLGPSAGILEAHPEKISASLMPLAAGDNPGLFRGKTAEGTLKEIDGRLASAKVRVHKKGFQLPTEEEGGIFYREDLPGMKNSFQEAATSPKPHRVVANDRVGQRVSQPVSYAIQ